MSGCFGNNPVDAWLERRVNEYTDMDDGNEEEFVDMAEELYGKCIGSHPEHGFIFEDGYGTPYVSANEDDHGRTVGYSLCGVETAKTFRTCDGKVLVKGGEYTSRWIQTQEINPKWAQLVLANEPSYYISKYVRYLKTTFKPNGVFFAARP